MNPILFVLSGLPGVGKSTLSQYIAKKYKAIYIRIDTIEQGGRDLCDFDVQGEGDELAYRIATDNLRLGANIVADSCNPILLTRNKWTEVAIQNNCILVNIEVVCSDKNEHKKRIENRVSEVQNLKLPTSMDVVQREYHTWEGNRILIDNAKNLFKQQWKTWMKNWLCFRE